MGDTHSVIFTPAGIRIDVAPETTVLDAARSAGVDIDSVCGGRGLCGRCQVVPSIGEFAKWGLSSRADALTAAGSTEKEYRGRRPLADGNRLGCQVHVLGDVVIDVPAESQVHRPVVRKAIDLGDIRVDPLITLHYVEVPDPSLGDERTDDELLRHQLESEWNLADLVVDVRVLPDLHP